MKKMFIILLALLFVFSSISIAFASDEAVLADLFFLRPLGLASLVGGTAVFVVSLPITAINRSISKSAKELVADPFNYTFNRPIGENSRGYSGQ